MTAKDMNCVILKMYRKNSLSLNTRKVRTDQITALDISANFLSQSATLWNHNIAGDDIMYFID